MRSSPGLLRSSPGLEQFELHWRQVGKSRVEPLAVVGRLNERPDGGPGMGEIAIGAGINLLVLERPHEALGHGVVIGAAGAAHAGLDPSGFKAGNVVTASVLNPAIRVVYEAAGNHLSAAQRHFECIQSEARPQVIRHGPANDLAAERVQHNSQVNKGLGQSHGNRGRFPGEVVALRATP